ncbi:hypothetical protein DNH61_24605 [Paenibacillus sambharensis]|uniref:Extracellular solute-binding protein n=1 Tax=Paenibacillus sambharensis TaxID=1803190 RepID=A0A2W1L305_9BACL|nr:ABC transporter substrate-binding protein [Paenibacillus sambharensis]PZD93229.1 hypothetical protein DNH61_24605 [Paenibacillus sambharensis]
MRTALIMIVFMLAVAGCRSPEPDEPVTITVNYPSIQQFNKMYGYAFETKFPHIQVKVVQDLELDAAKAGTTDLVYMNGTEAYKRAAQDGKLRAISYLDNGSELAEGLSPVVTALLGAAVPDGQLYGLAPTFHSAALYFNKTLFDEYRVPYPVNGMSWQDVFALASQFPAETTEGERLYGLQMNYYRDVTLNFIIQAGEAQQLSYMDPKTYKVTMNTDSWRKIWSYAVEAFRTGAVYDKGEDMDSMQAPAFFTQDAAMTVGSHNVAYSMEPFSRQSGEEVMDWGMVTVPADPADPVYSTSYAVYDIFGVSVAAEHPKEAAELLKFIVSDPVNSRLVARNQPNYGLPAITDYIIPVGEHDLSPLYALKPAPHHVDPYLVIEPEILDAFKTAAQAVLDKAIAGELTIEEAVAEAERSGQAAVDEARLKLGLGL